MVSPLAIVVDPAAGLAADAEAVRVAEGLGVPRLSADAWLAGAGGDVVLWLDDDGLALRGPAASRASPVRPLPPERRQGSEPLLKAVGPWTRVVDATAGWGGDAGVLAAAGRQVLMIERDPVMALLLRDALRRWQAAGLPAAERLSLRHGDALQLLPTSGAEVVLLDPMYPQLRKQGRKGEGLRLARALVGEDPDQDELLASAQAAAGHRVVVKRPLGAPPLAGRRPSGSIDGRTTRFDLYPAGQG